MFDSMIRTSLVGANPKFCPKPAQVDCEISSQLLATRSSAELDMDMQCEIFFRLKRNCFALQSGQQTYQTLVLQMKKLGAVHILSRLGGMGHQPVSTSRGTDLATVTVLEPRATQHGPKCRAFSLLSRLQCDLGSLSARPFHLGKPTTRKVNPIKHPNNRWSKGSYHRCPICSNL